MDHLQKLFTMRLMKLHPWERPPATCLKCYTFALVRAFRVTGNNLSFVLQFIYILSSAVLMQDGRTVL